MQLQIAGTACHRRIETRRDSAFSQIITLDLLVQSIPGSSRLAYILLTFVFSARDLQAPSVDCRESNVSTAALFGTTVRQVSMRHESNDGDTWWTVISKKAAALAETLTKICITYKLLDRTTVTAAGVGESVTPRLDVAEVSAIRQLIAGYRESAAFLSRSADELQQLILHQNS